MKPFLTIIILSFLILPLITLAQYRPPVSDEGIITGQNNGLVPCEGSFCGTCDVIILANTGIKMLLTLSFLFFAVIAVRAGFKLVISQGNSGALSEAKQGFTNAFIGLIIILVAWLIVDTFLRQLLAGGTGDVNGYGPWSKVQCTTQVEPGVAQEGQFDGDPEFRVTASGDNSKTFTAAEIASRVAAIKATPQVTAMVNKALDEAGITDPKLRNIYRALISQESSNCQNKVGPENTGNRGRAYGCSQFLVATARDFDARLDKRFTGKSNTEVATILQNDNTYSIRLGALYYKDALRKYSNNIDYTLASYNGGDRAAEASKDCPGLRVYQCTTVRNGYQQTRNYVGNIEAVAGKI